MNHHLISFLKQTLTVLWTLSLATLLSIHALISHGYFTSFELNSFIISTHKNFGAVLFAWRVCALNSGSNKWFNDFLSWKFWLPLEKLSFSIFLVHPMIQYALISSQRQPNNFEAQIVNYKLNFSFSIFSELKYLKNNTFRSKTILLTYHWQ
jgi:peptidoglycan/LPS O-acetylase OafA/YrhL